MMSNIEFRDSLLAQADGAFLFLVEGIDDLLNAAQFYAERYPTMTRSDEIKMANLNIATRDLGTLPRAIGGEIQGWKRDDERMLSKIGVETQLLNELYITIEVMMEFFISEGIDLKFSLPQVKQAYHELVRCNRLL
jgi:hypothetical protein